jgi:cytochrome c
MMTRIIAFLFFALFCAPVSANAQSADRGRPAFAQCAACHGIKAGEKKLAPTLFGIVGRKAGAVSGLAAPSTALARSGKQWTAKDLDIFLSSPSKMIPGTKMVVSVADTRRRADIVAYLATLK